jgi:long-chain acyl-CoA synthetase
MYRDDRGRYRSMTYGDLRAAVERVAAHLGVMGIGRGDKVAICAYHGPEWVIADLATLTLGAIVVPIYPTLSPVSIAAILRDSGSALAFAQDATIRAAIEGARPDLPALRTIVVFDADGIDDRAGFLKFSALTSVGAEAPRGGSAVPAAETAGAGDTVVSPDTMVLPGDPATIIYTSGTTGQPKGVVLSHSGVAFVARACVERFRVTASDVFLSFLPLCHALERTSGCYTMLFAGATIAYATSVSTVVRDARAVRPTIMVVVPRIVEKICEAAEKKVKEGSALRRRAAVAAIRSLNLRAALRRYERQVPLALRLRCACLDRFVAAKFREMAGGRLRLLVSGGAPLDRRLARLVWALGFNIVEGYGLTETSPTVTVSTPEANRLGTVGKPLPGVEVRIGAGNEVLVRGPNVMLGYHNRPEDTARAIDRAGWLHTGDQGRFDGAGHLVITGRLKEIIVTSYGKNVAPLPIEADIAASPYIDQVIVCGEGRKYITALVVPARDELWAFARERGLAASGYEDLLARAETRELIAREIETATAARAPYEKVKVFCLLPEGFTLANDLLTPTLKLRRGLILRRYADRIEAMYPAG